MRVRRIDKNHDMTFGRGRGNFADAAESVAQRVKTRLYLLNGEWFLDTTAGVPYLQKIATKPADLAYAESVLKQTILQTDGVATISQWQADLNRNNRRLSVSCNVTTIYGTTENIMVTL